MDDQMREIAKLQKYIEAHLLDEITLLECSATKKWDT